jgi:hypothetical protein
MDANTCPTCGSDCNERDELTKAEREITRLSAEVEALRADAETKRSLLLLARLEQLAHLTLARPAAS